MDTQFEEEVNGQVIGDYLSVSDLLYEGRKQGPRIYALNDDEVMQKAKDYIAYLKQDLGSSYRDIYPNEFRWTISVLESSFVYRVRAA